MTSRMGEDETGIDSVLIRKNTDGLYKMRTQSLGSFNMY